MYLQRLQPFKAGDTFTATCVYTPPGQSAPQPITDALTISSSVLLAGVLYSLTVTVNPDQSDNPGMFTAVLADTTGWAVGQAQMDIKYEYGGVIQHTDTMIFQVIEAITP